MELPEESLARHYSRASRNHFPFRLALHNVPEQHLLPNLRKQSFPNTGSRSQCCLRDLISINRHLPLPRNEANPDLPRTGSPHKEEGPATKDIKTTLASIDLATQGC